MATERIDYRITGDASDLDAAAKKGAASLAKMGKEADKAGIHIQGISAQTVGLAAGIAVADRVAQSIGRMAKATYDAALGFRDAAEAQGEMLSPEILAGLSQTEQAIGRINDAAGRLSATLVTEAAPAMGAFATFSENFATGAGAAASAWLGVFTSLWSPLTSRVSDAAVALVDLELRAISPFTDAVVAANVSSSSWTDQLQAAIESQARMAPATERTTRAVREQTVAFVADTKAKDEARRSEALAASMEAARVAKLKAGAQLAFDRANAEIEAARTAAEAQAEAAAMRAQQSQEADGLVLSSATATASALAGLAKKGSTEAAIASKGAALFGIAVNTAEAITKAGAQLGAFAFPAQIALGVLGATQAAIVGAQQPPSFDRGGVVTGGPAIPGGRPNQVLAQVEVGERIQTRGQQQGGGGTVNVSLRVGSREFARAVVDSGATDGLQRRRGFGQRRYGG